MEAEDEINVPIALGAFRDKMHGGVGKTMVLKDHPQGGLFSRVQGSIQHFVKQKRSYPGLQKQA